MSLAQSLPEREHSLFTRRPDQTCETFTCAHLASQTGPGGGTQSESAQRIVNIKGAGSAQIYTLNQSSVIHARDPGPDKVSPQPSSDQMGRAEHAQKTRQNQCPVILQS